MSFTKASNKQPTRRAQRAMARQEPLLRENTKSCMFIRGQKTSQVCMDALTGLKMLKKPDCVSLNDKNKMYPFEDETSVEFLAQKNASHNKKRPHNLVLGRLFNYKILDMLEVGVESFKPVSFFASQGAAQPSAGSKACLMFAGPEWTTNSTLSVVRSMFIDMFRGPVVDSVNLAGLDHVIAFSVSPTDPGAIGLRHYSIAFRKSGTKIPRVHLEECGPRLDMRVRRTQFADSDLRKQAMRQPKQTLPPAGPKNVATTVLKDKVGTLHMDRQQLQEIAVARPKALSKRKRGPETPAPGVGVGSGDGEGDAALPLSKSNPKNWKKMKATQKHKKRQKGR